MYLGMAMKFFLWAVPEVKPKNKVKRTIKESIILGNYLTGTFDDDVILLAKDSITLEELGESPGFGLFSWPSSIGHKYLLIRMNQFTIEP